MSDRSGATALLYKEIANMVDFVREQAINQSDRHCRIGKVTAIPNK